MKKLLLLSALSAILFSGGCVGIESQVRLNRDGSGTLTLTYTVSQLVKNLEAPGANPPKLPLPITEEEFRHNVEAAGGLKLSHYSRKEDEEKIVIEARMEFNRIDALNRVGGGGQMQVSLSERNGVTVFRQEITAEKDFAAASAESIQMIEALFEGYHLAFALETPSPIKSHSLGELSADRRLLTYKVNMAELAKNPKQRVLEATW